MNEKSRKTKYHIMKFPWPRTTHLNMILLTHFGIKEDQMPLMEKSQRKECWWFGGPSPTLSDKPSPNGNYVERRLKKCGGPSGLLFFVR